MKYSVDVVCDNFRKKLKMKYIFFWGHSPSYDGSITKSCLSQWYDCKFIVDGIEYHTAEQYMMSQKALLFGDVKINQEIMQANHPKQFKDMGRRISGFNEKIWNDNKVDIVIQGNYAKFSQNPELKAFLTGTYNSILVEASPCDRIWGIGISEMDKNINNPLKWNGENLLGFCFMEVRDMLLEENYD